MRLEEPVVVDTPDTSVGYGDSTDLVICFRGTNSVVCRRNDKIVLQGALSVLDSLHDGVYPRVIVEVNPAIKHAEVRLLFKKLDERGIRRFYLGSYTE